jgi:DNA-binding response OmpR family regulator
MDERVLMVEDDSSIREITSLGLGAAGFRVVTCADGREGLTRVRADGFDAAILDVMLPSLDGFEVCPGDPAVQPDSDQTELALTATEFRLLLELASRPGQVFSREQLLRRVWDYEFSSDTHLVDVAIQRLRVKVEDHPGQPRMIKTVRGFGYRLDRA